MPRAHQSPLVNGKLRRGANGELRINIQMTPADGDLIEAFLIENDLLDDPLAAIRALVLGSIRDPRWALAVIDRRKNLAAFRKAFFSRVIAKLVEVQHEVADELVLLDNELAMEANPDAHQT